MLVTPRTFYSRAKELVLTEVVNSQSQRLTDDNIRMLQRAAKVNEKVPLSVSYFYLNFQILSN